MPFERLSTKGLPFPVVDDPVATQELAELVEVSDAYIMEQWATDIVLTGGLTYAYKGGVVFTGGAYSQVADGTVTLVASDVNYVERDAAGVVTVNQAGFSTDKLPMAKVTTDVTGITALEDWRVLETPSSATVASHVVATTVALGSSHTVSALSSGMVLRATGPTTSAYGFLVASDIPALDASKITTGTLDVARGGTGVSGPTSGRILIGAGASAMTQLDFGAAGGYVRSTGSAWARSGLLASDLTGTTLPASIVTSSLTAVGTIVTGVWNGTTISSVTEAAVTAHQAALSIGATQLTGTIASARLSGVYSGITGLGTQAQALDMGANALTNVGAITASGVVTISASGKAIDLTGATSRRIHWGQVGSGPPTFNTLSAGVKIALWDNVDATKAGYSIGIGTASMWFGVADTSAMFEWYHGTGLGMQLTDTALKGIGVTLGTVGDPWGDAFVAALTTNGLVTLNGGNVLIGTTTDLGANRKLQVSEDGIARVVVTDASAGAGNAGILFRENAADQWAVASVSGDLLFFESGVGTQLQISAGGAADFQGNAVSMGALTANGDVISNAAGPRLVLHETDQAVDEKRWIWIAAAKDLYGQAVNDADSVTATWIQVVRGAGATISSVTFGSVPVSMGALTATKVTATGTGLVFSAISGGTGPQYARFTTTGGDLIVGVEAAAGNDLVVSGIGNAGIISMVGADPIQFGTTNAVRMTIAAGGNVGIGMASPSGTGRTLEIEGATDATVKVSGGGGSGNAYLQLNADGSANAYVNSIGAGLLIFGANGAASNHMTISSAGAIDFKTGTTKFNTVTYTWPGTAGGDGDVLTSNGAGALSWTAGGGGGLGGSGTAGKIAKWSATSTLADSIMTESGSTITVAGLITAGGNGWIRNDVANTFLIQMGSSGLIIRDSTNVADRVTITDAGAVTIAQGLTVSGTMAALDMAGQIDLNNNNIIAGGTAAFTTVTAALSGNASTATILLNARTINGVSFNGSANITVTAAAGTLTGTTLKSTVVASSLTSVGTLTSLDMGGNIDLNTNNIIAGGAAAFTKVTISSSAGIVRSITNGANIFSGGSTNILGANIVLYGESHATQAKDWELRSGTTIRVNWNESSLLFRVRQNFRVDGDIGFYGTATQPRGSVIGTTDGNVALQNLLTDLNDKGLIADATT